MRNISRVLHSNIESKNEIEHQNVNFHEYAHASVRMMNAKWCTRCTKTTYVMTFAIRIMQWARIDVVGSWTLEELSFDEVSNNEDF
jgi:hypothetical protein